MVFYSVTYTYYDLLLKISSAGIPFAIAALVAKYVTKEDYKTALVVKKLGTSLVMGLSFISALIFILISEPLARQSMGSLASAQDIQQLKTLFMILLVAVILVPYLSSIRSYYQGLKRLDLYASSQVLSNNDVINEYLGNQYSRSSKSLLEIKEHKGNGILRFTNIRVEDLMGNVRDTFAVGESIRIVVDFERTQSFDEISNSRIDIGINDLLDTRITWLSTQMFMDKIPSGWNSVQFELPSILLNEGTYNFNLFCNTSIGVADWVQNVYKLTIEFHDFYKTGRQIPSDQGPLITNYTIRGNE